MVPLLQLIRYYFPLPASRAVLRAAACIGPRGVLSGAQRDDRQFITQACRTITNPCLPPRLIPSIVPRNLLSTSSLTSARSEDQSILNIAYGKSLKSVFVKNLSFESTEDDLRAAFPIPLVVNRVEIIQKDDVPGQPRYAVVDFATARQAKWVLTELNDAVVNGRLLTFTPNLRWPKAAVGAAQRQRHGGINFCYKCGDTGHIQANCIANPKEARASKVFIYNLPHALTNDELQPILMPLGLKRVDVFIPGRAIAFFKSAAAAENAIASVDGRIELENRLVRAKLYRERAKS